MASDGSDSGDDTDFIETVALAAAVVACVPAMLLFANANRSSGSTSDVDRENSIPRDPSIVKDRVRKNYLSSLIHGSDETCLNMFRMKKESFSRLSAMLRNRRLLQDTLHVSVEEQLAMFLHTIGHNERIRVVGQKFYRSAETVSRYYKHVLAAIVALRADLVKPPDSTTSTFISSDDELMPYFKDCIGAVDTVQIDATVPTELVDRFRGPKGTPTQHVLVAANFDLRISYVLAGWEGSVDKMTILRSALTKPNGFQVLEGKYYVAAEGFATMPGFIAPYSGVLNHPTEFIEHPPTNKEELFNMWHFKLQNIVGRAIRILRKRFKILSLPPFLPFETQVDTVLACCIIHNHVMGIDPNEGGFLAEVIQEEESRSESAKRKLEVEEKKVHSESN